MSNEILRGLITAPHTPFLENGDINFERIDDQADLFAASGVSGVFLCGYTGRPPRPEISKTALGAENVVPWEGVDDPAKAVVLLQRRDIPVYVLEHTDQSGSLWESPTAFPLGLVIGNEVDGVSPHVVDLADGALELPMFGVKESLNVAVACGVALYELARRVPGRRR